VASWHPCNVFDLPLTITTEEIKASKPCPIFSDERELDYDIGRIHYFIDQLKKGEKIDPIEQWQGVYIRTVTIIVYFVDGNHRLAAYWLNKNKVIPAVYGGRMDLLHYLEGKRKTCPRH